MVYILLIAEHQDYKNFAHQFKIMVFIDHIRTQKLKHSLLKSN